MLDTRLDSLATFSGSLNFQMYACENRRENKLKVTGEFFFFFSFYASTAKSINQLYL